MQPDSVQWNKMGSSSSNLKNKEKQSSKQFLRCHPTFHPSWPQETTDTLAKHAVQDALWSLIETYFDLIVNVFILPFYYVWRCDRRLLQLDWIWLQLYLPLKVQKCFETSPTLHWHSEEKVKYPLKTVVPNMGYGDQ